MLKREITYEDFDGNTHTEVFYFNLSKPELVELDVEYGKKGLAEIIDEIIKTEDHKGLIEQFKKIVLLAYGERSEDGKRFVKTDEIRDGFKHHAAYNELFMELATNDDSAATFLKGVLPKDLVGKVDMDKTMEEVQLPQPKEDAAPAAPTA